MKDLAIKATAVALFEKIKKEDITKASGFVFRKSIVYPFGERQITLQYTPKSAANSKTFIIIGDDSKTLAAVDPTYDTDKLEAFCSLFELASAGAFHDLTTKIINSVPGLDRRATSIGHDWISGRFSINLPTVKTLEYYFNVKIEPKAIISIMAFCGRPGREDSILIASIETTLEDYPENEKLFIEQVRENITKTLVQKVNEQVALFKSYEEELRSALPGIIK